MVEQLPEDLGALHDGVIVLTRCLVCAEGVPKPGPVILLCVELVFDAVPLPACRGAQGGHAGGIQLVHVGDPCVKGRRLLSDVAFEYDRSGALAERQVRDPPEVMESRIGARAVKVPDAVSGLERKKGERLVPERRLPPLLYAEEIFPPVLLADVGCRGAAEERVPDDDQRQPRKEFLQPLGQAVEGFQFAVLLVSLWVRHIHELVEERQLQPPGEDAGLKDVAEARRAPGHAVLRALPALLADGAVDDDDVPLVKKPRVVERPGFDELADHLDGQLGHLARVSPRCVTRGVVPARDPRGPVEALVIGALPAEPGEALRCPPRVPLRVEGVARPVPGKEHGQYLHPDVLPGIHAHVLHPGIRQFAHPLPQAGELPREECHYLEGDRLRLGRRVRLAARRFATWRLIMDSDCPVTFLMSALSFRYSFVHALTSGTSSIGT